MPLHVSCMDNSPECFIQPNNSFIDYPQLWIFKCEPFLMKCMHDQSTTLVAKDK